MSWELIWGSRGGHLWSNWSSFSQNRSSCVGSRHREVRGEPENATLYSMHILMCRLGNLVCVWFVFLVCVLF